MLVAQNLLERVDNESWSPRLFYGPLLGQGIRYVNEDILWLFFSFRPRITRRHDSGERYLPTVLRDLTPWRLTNRRQSSSDA